MRSSEQKSRPCEFSEISEAIYKWRLLATTRKSIRLDHSYAEKNRQIAKQLGVNHLKTSNGWLDWWKKRYNIHKVTINGESGVVSGDTIVSWKERIPELLRGYLAKNIWNLDETGCFWHALPEYGFGRKVSQCNGGKRLNKDLQLL